MVVLKTQKALNVIRYIGNNARYRVLLPMIIIHFSFLLLFKSTLMSAIALAVVTTLLLNTLVFALELRKFNRPMSIFIVWTLFVLAILLFRSITALAYKNEMVITGSTTDLQLPVAEMKMEINAFSQLLQKVPESRPEKLLAQIFQKLLSALGPFRRMVQPAPVYLLVIALTPLLLLLNLKASMRWFIACLPNPKVERFVLFSTSITKKLTGYFITSVCQAASTFLLVVLALYLLKVPFYYTWAVIGAFASLVPFYLGLVIGMIPPILTIYFSAIPDIEIAGVFITFAVVNLFNRMILFKPMQYQFQQNIYLLPVFLIVGWLAADLWGTLLALPIGNTLIITWQEIKGGELRGWDLITR